jgi:hypothetical protein
MSFYRDKKGALEMSMTTIVTIVLIVVTLVLALVLIRTIFTSSTNAVTQVSVAIQNQINQLFASQGGDLQIYPATPITIKRGDSTPYGFQFAVQNSDNNPATFNYNVSATDLHNCGSSFTEDDANGFILNGKGVLTASSGKVSDNQVILFKASNDAPACTVTYTLTVIGTGTSAQFATSGQMFVTLD